MCDSSMCAALSVRVVLVPAAVDALAGVQGVSRGPRRLGSARSHDVPSRPNSGRIRSTPFTSCSGVSWGEVGATCQARRWLAPSTCLQQMPGPRPIEPLFRGFSHSSAPFVLGG